MRQKLVAFSSLIKSIFCFSAVLVKSFFPLTNEILKTGERMSRIYFKNSLVFKLRGIKRNLKKKSCFFN